MTQPAEEPAIEPAIPVWTLGWRLQRALAWGSISVQAMADELGVSRTTLSRWLHDVGARPPRTIYLRAWAARCRVPYEWLAHGDEGQLPRVDSNHQPAGWCLEPGSARAELLAMRKTIRAGSRQIVSGLR